MSSNNSWVEADTLIAEKDENETIRKRWQQLTLYLQFAALPVDQHGLGRDSQWVDKYTPKPAMPVLHEEDFNDADFSRYLLWIFNAYKNKEKIGAKSTCRHGHSWGSYMCLIHGKGSNLKTSTFVLTNKLWPGIWKKVKKEKSEYAPGTTEDDESKIHNYRVIIPETLGRPEGPVVTDIDEVKRKYLWELRRAMANRKTLIHELKEGDIVIDTQWVTDPLRPSLMLTTAKTKWNDNEDSHCGPCQCVDELLRPIPHIKYSDLCRVGLHQLHDRDKQRSNKYLESPGCRNTAKNKGWHWRRTANKPKPYQNEKYHSYQRWGKDTQFFGMAHNLRWWDEKVDLSIKCGTNPDVARNERYTKFTSHSDKVGSIRRMEICAGHLLTDGAKMALAKHKTMKQVNKYNHHNAAMKNRALSVVDMAENMRKRRKCHVLGAMNPYSMLTNMSASPLSAVSMNSYQVSRGIGGGSSGFRYNPCNTSLPSLPTLPQLPQLPQFDINNNNNNNTTTSLPPLPTIPTFDINNNNNNNNNNNIIGDTSSGLSGGRFGGVSGDTLNALSSGTSNGLSNRTLNGLSGGTLSGFGGLSGDTSSGLSGGTLNGLGGNTLNGLSGGTLSGLSGGTLNGLGGNILYNGRNRQEAESWNDWLHLPPVMDSDYMRFPGDSRPLIYGDRDFLVDLHGGSVLSRMINKENHNFEGYNMQFKNKYDNNKSL